MTDNTRNFLQTQGILQAIAVVSFLGLICFFTQAYSWMPVALFLNLMLAGVELREQKLRSSNHE